MHGLTNSLCIRYIMYSAKHFLFLISLFLIKKIEILSLLFWISRHDFGGGRWVGRTSPLIHTYSEANCNINLDLANFTLLKVESKSLKIFQVHSCIKFSFNFNAYLMSKRKCRGNILSVWKIYFQYGKLFYTNKSNSM